MHRLAYAIGFYQDTKEETKAHDIRGAASKKQPESDRMETLFVLQTLLNTYYTSEPKAQESG